MSKKASTKSVKAQNKAASTGTEYVPEGLIEVTGERVAGWFAIVAGNAIRGILRDSFEVKSKFTNADGNKKKRVYKIEVVSADPAKSGPTLIYPSDPEDETEAKNGRGARVGELVGLDEKGWLKGLSRIEIGREVWVRCDGKLPSSAEYPQGAWQFKIMAVPAPAGEVKHDPVTGEVL
jgi:hypothetical protein